MVWNRPANDTTKCRNPDRRLARNLNNTKTANDSEQHICSTGNNTKVSPPFFTEAQLISVVRRFDVDRDGRLSREELKNAFNSLGSRFPTYRAFAVLHHADKDGSGYISEDEMDALIQYALSCGYYDHE